MANGVRKVSHSALLQHEREGRLNGVYFDSTKEGWLSMAATDSFKLSLYNARYSGPRFAFLVNTKVLELISGFLKVNEEVVFKTKGRSLAIQTPDFLLMSNVIESAAYPDVNELLRGSVHTAVKVNRQKLIEATERVISFSINDQSMTAEVGVSGSGMEISYRKLEIGSSKETVEVVQFRGTPLEFIVNPRYLINHLRAFDNDEVVFEIEGDLKPMVLKDEREPDFVQVLVPMMRTAA